MDRRRRRRPWFSLVAAAVLSACHCDHDTGSGAPAPAALVITSVSPASFVAYKDTEFTITGSGFMRAFGSDPNGPDSITDGVLAATVGQVTVTFRTNDGTPFANGTASAAQITGSVINDTEIRGTSPITDAPGIWPSSIEVRDTLGSATSATAIAQFGGLTVSDVSTPQIRADQVTPFRVFGLSFLPAPGTATIRFTATVAGAFVGGSDTLEVPGTIDNDKRISGVTPVLSLTAPVAAFVTVVLDGESSTPQATSSCVLVDFVPPPPVPVVVNSITSPLPIGVPTPFTIMGSGFLGAGDPDVEVTFTASPGTPFSSGTATAVTVLGTATSDNTVTGTSPIGTATENVSAFVTVSRADGELGTSTSPIALFTVPTAAVIDFSPNVLRTDVASPFTITGSSRPSPGTATVRFQATAGTPFAGGTSDTVDVLANVTTPSQIDGLSPLASATVPFLSTVTVLLSGGLELPMGVACLFFTPPPNTLLVTNLNDSGPGSLRQALIDAAPPAVITFDPSLTGDLEIDSTLVVQRSVHILGRGPGVIRITAQQGDYPAFTIQPTATETVIEQLSIVSSHHNGNGGGCAVLGGLELSRCELSDHHCDGGGACAYVAPGATLRLTDCTLRDSTSDVSGGAVFADDGASVEIAGCTINDNEARAGGAAIAADAGAAVNVENSTITRNAGTGGPGGGAILVATGSTVTLVHCTLADNSTANRGGGVLVQGTLHATNCIFARNSDGKGEPEISNKGGTNDTTFSLVRVGSGSGLSDGANGNLVGTPVEPLDAELGPLQANGGPTRTMALRPDSPALNAATLLPATPKDQRGVLRPQGPASDMGAYEADVTL